MEGNRDMEGLGIDCGQVWNEKLSQRGDGRKFEIAQEDIDEEIARSFGFGYALRRERVLDWVERVVAAAGLSVACKRAVLAWVEHGGYRQAARALGCEDTCIRLHVRNAVRKIKNIAYGRLCVEANDGGS